MYGILFSQTCPEGVAMHSVDGIPTRDAAKALGERWRGDNTYSREYYIYEIPDKEPKKTPDGDSLEIAGNKELVKDMLEDLIASINMIYTCNINTALSAEIVKAHTIATNLFGVLKLEQD